MINNPIECDMFQEVFQKLTFTYCFPLPTLCDLSYRKELEFLELADDIITEEYIKSIRRYGRILSKLCVEDWEKDIAGFLIEKPKIYDEFVSKSQIDIYNSVAELVGFSPIKKVLPISLIKDAAFLDGASPDYDTIVKHYPYYLDKERKGVNFMEFVLLINIYLTIHMRSLYTLNKPLLTTKDKERAKHMVSNIVDNMCSKKMFPFYVYAIFDILESVKVKTHNIKANEYIRTAWLPEHYKSRKDAFRALETHFKNEKKINFEKYEKTQIENIIKTGTYYEQLKMFNSMLDYNAVAYIAEEIFPITYGILLDVIDDIDIDENTIEYRLAVDYADIIKAYIDKTLLEATTILNRLYIEDRYTLNIEG